MRTRAHLRSASFVFLLAFLLLIAAHASAGVSGDVIVPGTPLTPSPGEESVLRDLAIAACAFGRSQLENISSVLGGAGVSAVVITCAMACATPA
jgi:hypothetical protein